MSFNRHSLFEIALILAGVAACDSDNTDNTGAGGSTDAEYGSGGTRHTTTPGGSNLSGASGSGGNSATTTTSGGASSTYTSPQGGVTSTSGAAGSRASGGVPSAGSSGVANVAGNAGNATILSATLDDAEVVHVLNTLNTGEVEQAHVATAKAQSITVRNFAQRMITEHTTATTTTNTVASAEQLTASNNQVSAALKGKSDAVVVQLNAATAAQFDRVYITAQVAAHQEALALIDANLLPSAQRAAVDSLLSNLRTSIAAHLVEAQGILAALP